MTFERDAPDEQALIARSLQHDREAFGLLVERYAEPVLNLIRRITGDQDDAEDLAQETFLAAFRALPSFRGDARLLTWLHRIAVNKCHDWFRSRRPLEPWHEPEDSGGGPEPAADTNTPERALAQKEVADLLEGALQALPAVYREAFVLKHVEGLSYEEMSKILDASQGALKMRVYKARAQVRMKLAHLHEQASTVPEKRDRVP